MRADSTISILQLERINDSIDTFPDFGLSKFYIDENGKHVVERPEVIGEASAGTIRYMSMYAHRHRVVSRRDDIESIGLVLIYMLRGHVNWASRQDDSMDEKIENVLAIKKRTSLKVVRCDKSIHLLLIYNSFLGVYLGANRTGSSN